MKFNKTIYSILVLLLLFSKSYAQVSIGKGHTYFGFKEFGKSECELIKTKTTVFVLEGFDTTEINKVLSEVWTLNKFIVLDAKDFESRENEFNNDKYAVFKGTFKKEIRYNGSQSSTSVYVGLIYYYQTEDKSKKNKPEYIKEYISKIYLSPSLEFGNQVVSTDTFTDLKKGIYNYKLGYLKNYFQIVNNTINSKGAIDSFENYCNKSKIKELKTKTLYIPDYIKTKFQMLTSSTKEVKIEELFKNYNFKYELISSENLDQKILNGNEDFYYLSYVNSQGIKFISVTNGKTGEIIYRDFNTTSNNILKSDISQINSKIKQNKKTQKWEERSNLEKHVK